MTSKTETRGTHHAPDEPWPVGRAAQHVVDKLGKIPFLGSVHPRRLGALAKASFLRTYEDGDEIVREGEHGHTMFLVLSGQVAVHVTNLGGEQDCVAFLSSGDWFGEGVLLGRSRRNATVISSGQSLLLEVEKVRIEKLGKVHKEVIPRIQEEADLRSIDTFLRQHRAFAKLSPSERQSVVDVATLKNASRGSALFQEGDSADSVLIVKIGVTKLFRTQESTTNVLAYFNSGDVIGLHDGDERPGSLAAMGWTEVIDVPRENFQELIASVEQREPGWGDQFHKAGLEPASHLAVGGEQTTVYKFVDALMADGAQQAQSLLTIDLDLCVRCGNCVRSCEARHGHAKLTRRGKKLIRRRKLEQRGDHKAILFPSSCRHCDSPECMIGCPTGAIHRIASGEVAIHDFCIGCSNCALRCPWDNITMVETPGRVVEGLATPTIASKCDLCAGYDEANCVHNCPTAAILRVEPTSYFEEVRGVLGSPTDHAVGGARTETEDKRDLSRPILWLFAVLIAGLLIGVYVTAQPYRVMSLRGVGLGGVALFFMLAATALAARRRFNRFPRKRPKPDARRVFKTGALQLGPFYWWARAHAFLGGLALLAVALHSGFSSGALVTSLLVILMVFQVLTGLFGVIFYRWFPRVVSRLERESLLEEDVQDELRNLRTRREQLLEEEDEEVKAAAAGLERRAGWTVGRLFADYDPKAEDGKALERLGSTLSAFDLSRQKLLEQIVLDAVRVSEVQAILRLYAVRKGWLALHIGITAMLLTLTGLHVWSVFGFVGGLLG